MHLFFIIVIMNGTLSYATEVSSFFKFGEYKFENKKNWVYVYQKKQDFSNNEGSTDSDSSYNCVQQNTGDIYDAESLTKYKQILKNKAKYIVSAEDKSDSFYLIQDLAKLYGVSKISNVEGLLYTKTKEKCLNIKSKVKVLVDNYFIEQKEKFDLTEGKK